MRPSDELRHAFPAPDEGFRACIRCTLDDLAGRRERRIIPMKRKNKASVGALIAAATLIVTTIAAGAAVLHYGVFDFMNPTLGQPLPEATQLIQTPKATAQIPVSAPTADEPEQKSAVTLSLREVLYDGISANVVIAATPADDSILLLPADSAPDYPVTDLGIEGSQTIAEYARANGKTQAYCLSIIDQAIINGETGFVGSEDFKMEPDGTLVICVSNEHASVDPNVPIEMICVAAPMDLTTGERDADAVLRVPLTFTLDNAGAETKTRTLSTPTAFANTGVILESVELTSTDLGLYYTITCRVTDPATFDALEGGLCFWFLDESGQQLKASAAASSGIAEDAEGVFTQKGALAPTDRLPDAVTLRAVSIWQDKAVLDTQTIR